MAQKVEQEKPEGSPAGVGGPHRAGVGDRPPQSPEALLARLADDAHAAAAWESLQGMRPSRRLELVRGIAERPDLRARKLLAAALWDDRAAVALAAVEGLRRLGDARAVESLEGVAEISRVERVAAAAVAAAAELHARDHQCPIDCQDQGQASRPRSRGGEGRTGEAEYWASFIDGDGAQLLMAVRPAGENADPCRLRLASVAVSDQRGFLDASGTEGAAQAEVEAVRNAGSRRSREGPRAVEKAGGGSARAPRGTDRRIGAGACDEELPEIGWVRVDGAYCAGVIEAARQIHRRDRRRLPGAWEFWRDDFGGSRETVVVALDDRALPHGQLRRRLAQTATLIHFEGFRSWLILGEDLAPFLPAALQALKRRSPDREVLLAQVVSACLACAMKKRQRRLWRSRLLRQAALWERRGDRIVRELCLAAAWGLDDRNQVPSEEHPLLRAMARASLEWAIGA